MPWQTVDARPQKRRKGDAVEDAERRELRLRRTYNEAAAGHAALAAKAASAPPADAVAALYEKILEDVGSAAKENEAPWDAALRLACARHLSELLEAAGDRAGALAAACRAADAGRNDAGLWLRVARLARVAEGVAAARVAVGALQRAAALRRAEREDDGALERAARAVGVKRACFRGVAADAAAAPPAPRTVRSSRTWTGLGSALLAARAQRPQPGRDDKVVTAWNGLAITALVEAGFALQRPALLAAAAECARSVLDLHVVGGRLRRASLGGVVGASESAAFVGVAEYVDDAEADGGGDEAHDGQREGCACQGQLSTFC